MVIGTKNDSEEIFKPYFICPFTNEKKYVDFKLININGDEETYIIKHLNGKIGKLTIKKNI